MQELDDYIASLKAHPELARLLAPLFALIERQAAEIVALKAEVAELKARLNQNSGNSHKPPSSDGYAKKPAIPREKGSKQGGQRGHRGSTLKMACHPDEVDTVWPEQCTGCGHPLYAADVVHEERRQVFDLPEPRLHIKEYRRALCRCPGCGLRVQAPFPEGVRAPAQYGVGVMALCALLHNEYHMPVGKIGQLFGDLFGDDLAASINESTILSASGRAYARLEGSEQAIRDGLRRSALLHVDETGLRCEGRLHWLHSASNTALTYYFVHRKRGRDALDSSASLLPGYRGYLVHDCWSSYFRFDQAQHALCGAHLLRELTAQVGQGYACASQSHWASDLIALLLDAHEQVAREGVLDRSTYYRFKERYFALLRAGLATHWPYLHQPGQAGRKSRGKARSLIKRLIKHHQAVWAFARHPQVPFTNNQAERDIRMVKLKQKINGGFRTTYGAAIFARTRGFCSTVRKQGQSVFAELRRALEEPDYVVCLQQVPK